MNNFDLVFHLQSLVQSSISSVYQEQFLFTEVALDPI